MYRIGDNSTVRAAIYCRISLARFGDTIKVDEQERVCRDLAAARKWTVHDTHVYKDPNRSAWLRNRKRPGWDSMLAAIERREIDAIIVYHGDRLIRQPSDLELLLRLADERRLQLASVTGHRDLSNEDDRFILRIEAAAASREVGATSRRLKRYYDQRAEQGMVRKGGRGGRAYGFDPDGVTVREAEAELIREVAGRILRGESVSAICRDINARGFRTTTGTEFGRSPLAQLMRRPRLAGLVEHHGRVVGPAVWPAILDRDTWEQVCAVLAGRAQALGFTPSNAARYWLSGIAECGTCGSTLVARYKGRGGGSLAEYGCLNLTCGRRVFRAIHNVDAFVEGAVVALLADPRIRTRLAPATAPHLAEELTRLEARRRQRITRFAELAATSDDDDPEAEGLRAAVAAIDERIAAVRAELGVSVVDRTLDGLSGVSLAEFRGLPLERRRAVVRALLRVVVLPTDRRGPKFDPSAIRLTPLR